MTTLPIINKGSSYYAGSKIEDEINGLMAYSAIAPNIQSVNAIATWVTDQVGPLSEHNLLRNTGVIIDDDDNIEGIKSLSITTSAANPGDATTLWINSADGHVYRGSVDLENTTPTNQVQLYYSVTGPSDEWASNTTLYWNNYKYFFSTSDNTEWQNAITRMDKPFNLTHLSMGLNTALSVDTITIRIKKNGANSIAVLTLLPGTSSSGTDTDVSFTAGDFLTMSISKTGIENVNINNLNFKMWGRYT